MKDNRKIKTKYNELLQVLGTNEGLESAQLHLAYDIANSYYGDKLREWGEPYIIHALETACICAKEINLGITSATAILLQDAVLNYHITLGRIKTDFVPSVYIIVEGLIKIVDIGNEKTKTQSENFSKLLLNLAGDMRVILIKLAERLNIMRNAQHFSHEDQLKISSDALYLYAPLAHRLGLYKIKSEMEDLSLKLSDYRTYKGIAKQLKDTAKARNQFIKEFIAPIQVKLENNNLKCEIKGRPKSIFSIWNKMTKQNVGFDDVYDKFAIRVILDSEPDDEKSDCWKVYSLITETYQPNPRRLRDWISVPKSNGYESLHTTVVVPGGQWVEVQIRTVRMDEIAEKGLAAHWKYKGVKNDQGGVDNWLAKIRDLLELHDSDSKDLIDNFKLSLYSKEIFVFTPQGDLKNFPKGATVLDFAYDIHTGLGDTCVGAKLNGKNVGIKQEMQNGDKVEIVSSKNQKPKTDWLNFVVTSKAKSKIRIALKEEKLKEAENGKEIIKRRFKNWKVEYDDVNILKLLKYYKIKTAIDLYYLVATGKIDILEIKEVVLDQKVLETKTTPPKEATKKTGQNAQSEDLLTIDGSIDNVEYKLAKCCNPIFGDEIFGFVTVLEGIKIHRVNCPNARDMISRYNYRVVKAVWSGKGGMSSYQAALKIIGVDEPDILNKISEMISKDMGINLRSLNIETGEGFFEGNLKVLIHNTNHLEGLIKRLKSIQGINTVVRLDT